MSDTPIQDAYGYNLTAFEHFCNFLEKTTGPIDKDLVNVARFIMQTSISLQKAKAIEGARMEY